MVREQQRCPGQDGSAKGHSERVDVAVGVGQTLKFTLTGQCLQILNFAHHCDKPKPCQHHSHHPDASHGSPVAEGAVKNHEG